MKKLTLRNILVPTDLSPMSIQAMEDTRKLAHTFNATIQLAYVHHQQYALGYLGPVLAPGEPIVSFEEHGQATLGDELREVAHRAGLPSSTTVHLRVGGSAFHEICRLAHEIPADLIVMPTHGRTGLKHILLGSTTERVVQHSPCPVLVTRPRSGGLGASITEKLRLGRQKSVLVPVDFSTASFQAVGYTIEFAERIGAKLLILHVAHLGDGLTVQDLKTFRFARARKAARAEAQRRMEEFLQPVKFRSVEADILIRFGKPPSEICTVADQRNIDLIITATHGLTGLDHLLMGSVAEQVVRRARQPVLVVPSHPRGRLEGFANLIRRDLSAEGASPKIRTRRLPAMPTRNAAIVTRNVERPIPSRRV